MEIVWPSYWPFHSAPCSYHYSIDMRISSINIQIFVTYKSLHRKRLNHAAWEGCLWFQWSLKRHSDSKLNFFTQISTLSSVINLHTNWRKELDLFLEQVKITLPLHEQLYIFVLSLVYQQCMQGREESLCLGGIYSLNTKAEMLLNAFVKISLFFTVRL